MGRTAGDTSARYEYRVWGRRKRVRKQLAKLADATTVETFADCYFLSDTDDVNVKVRTDALKVKERVGRKRGFDRWTRVEHRSSDDAPRPYDDLIDDLRLHKAHKRSWDLAERVERIDDDLDLRPVFVTKTRRRHTIGTLRAEVTDIAIDETGEVLHTIAIEGDDLDALVKLRKRLGLKGEDNVAVHQAIDDAL